MLRCSIKKHYFNHIKRIANGKNGLVLLLTNRDLQAFVRRAIRGKFSENHIQDRYDNIVRKIS